MIHALLPAAGKSVRMGRAKLVLPVGSSTVLARLIDTLRQGGVESILVIVAPQEEQIAAIARGAGAKVIHLAAETPDMRATVCFGLNWLVESGFASEEDGCLLIPADHPALTVRSLAGLLQAQEQATWHQIFVPTFQGVRGHPVILPVSCKYEIENLPANFGINEVVRRHESETLLVPVDDPAVLWDLDTPEDYQRLLAYFATQPELR
ncbi:nucleotidyltransferase family protein [soil metagenome]